MGTVITIPIYNSRFRQFRRTSVTFSCFTRNSATFCALLHCLTLGREALRRFVRRKLGEVKPWTMGTYANPWKLKSCFSITERFHMVSQIQEVLDLVWPWMFVITRVSWTNEERAHNPKNSDMLLKLHPLQYIQVVHTIDIYWYSQLAGSSPKKMCLDHICTFGKSQENLECT